MAVLFIPIKQKRNKGYHAFFHKFVTEFYLKANNVEYSTYRTGGIPVIRNSKTSKIIIGKNFSMNNGLYYNTIGCMQPCTLSVGENSEIIIGENVGISQTTMIAQCPIHIGNNVKIGGGTCIYTTDFHSLDPAIRNSKNDACNCKKAPVNIGNNVFIGAHCIILKGVTIGNNSIIGAGSVVAKSIPDDCIAAGNPAKIVKYNGPFSPPKSDKYRIESIATEYILMRNMAMLRFRFLNVA